MSKSIHAPCSLFYVLGSHAPDLGHLWKWQFVFGNLEERAAQLLLEVLVALHIASEVGGAQNERYEADGYVLDAELKYWDKGEHDPADGRCVATKPEYSIVSLILIN